MKMKKIVCAMVSAALLVSMAAATAFAVESVPSKTGTDADAGKTDVSVSGSASSEGLKVEVKTTEDSSKEETQLKGEGVEKYLKAADQLEWVRRMNSIRNRAEEIIKSELIFV